MQLHRRHRWLPFGYPFNGLTCPLVSADVTSQTIAPLGHPRAGLLVGECSEGLT
jgi:hypothetical protein